MGKIMTDEHTQFFELPGITDEVKSLENQLGASSECFDHIVISGPKGVGKSYFVQIIKRHFCWYKVEGEEFKTIDCGSITEEEMAGLKRLDTKDKKLVIFENLENLPPEGFNFLSFLLKRVRVVVTTRDDLPDEFIDKFTISIVVPPLHKRRDDIFHFIAWKFPSIFLTNVDLIRLFAYHWPGNLSELDRTIKRLKADHKFPYDIDKKVPEAKICDLFNCLYNSGLQPQELFLTHDSCFSHIIPKGDSGSVFSETVELMFANNDSSSDIEALVDPEFSTLILNGREVRWIFNSFFGLIYGRNATFQDQILFDLKPFTAESLKIIIQAQKDVFQWRVGDPYSTDYFFNFSYFQHFSKSLSEEEIAAAASYLRSCLSACEVACPIVHVERPRLITLKEATDEGYLNKSELLRQAEEGTEKLELLLYVRYVDIEKAVSLPDLTSSNDFGDYLVIPHYFITTLIEHEELDVQDFLLSKVYPRSPGLIGIILPLTDKAGKAINTLRTVKPYNIKLSECYDKIKVVRQQVEKFYKGRAEIKGTTEPLYGNGKPSTRFVAGKLLESASLHLKKYQTDGENHGDAQKQKKEIVAQVTRGGAPKSSITEAIEHVYDKLIQSGNTELVKEGNIRIFLKYLKECTTEGNANFSDYVAERIKEVKNVAGECKIVMQTRTDKEKLNYAKTQKNTRFNTARVSNILTGLRNKK